MTTSAGEEPRPGRPPEGVSPIYHAKLRPAVNPEYLLARPRLYRLLDEVAQAPLTLVVAPAGAGKTSLLRGWLAESDRPHAWLSLDDSDRDPVQLWLGMMAALEGIAPGCSAEAAELVRQPGSLLEAVGVLLDDLEERSCDARVLIVDDLQLVDEDEAVLASLSTFGQHLPRWLHLVIASRRTPRLPVHRLRARGELGEVTFAELRFSVDEAAAVLERLAPALDQERRVEIAGRSGGWAASIQLAGLAARASDARGPLGAPSPADGGRQLEDYVWYEVLASERPEVVETLTAVAVVDRVDPRLASVLAGRPDATDLLAQAEGRGLFVTRIEPSGVFEIHALVRDALLAVERRRSPEAIVRRHGVAAQWYEDHDQTIQALDHWLRAEQPHQALRLLFAREAELYDGGGESTIRRTIDAIPIEVPAADFSTTVEMAWCQLLVDRQRYLQTVDYLTAWADDDPELATTSQARLAVLRSVAATMSGDWAQGAELARSALTTLGATWLVDPLGVFSWNMVAREIALDERWDDDSAEVRAVQRSLGVVRERRVALEGTRALGNALSGHPVDALRVAAGARRASEVASMMILRTEIATAEAIAARELGDVETARTALQELSERDVEPVPYCRLLACLELTRMWILEGNLPAAERTFGWATEITDLAVSGPGGRTWLASTGTVLSLAAGRLEDARGWASQVRDPFWSGIKQARVRLAEGDRDGAADALRAARPRAVRHQVVLGVLSSRVGDGSEAEEQLRGATRLAARHGLVQTVASEGPEVIEAVERLAWELPQTWLDRLRRAAVPSGTDPVAEVVTLVESLTDRELEVLRLLPSRLTLREIADELVISVNTLKFHLKVIYRKLGCRSRAEAAELARALTSLRGTSQSPSIRRR